MVGVVHLQGLNSKVTMSIDLLHAEFKVTTLEVGWVLQIEGRINYTQHMYFTS